MASIWSALSSSHLRVFPILLLLQVLAPMVSEAGSYDQKKSIYDTVLSSSRYNPLQRPLRDQRDILYVSVIFELVSIVEVNDLVQSFRCNGFLGLGWHDQILTWNASDYGGETTISPKVTSVFRPLMVMLNTLGDRDLFEDDHAPLTVFDDGEVSWVPGSIFPASCKLDLTKFPFDEQNCEIQMVIMNYGINELLFVPQDGVVGMTFFTKNGLWDITNHTVSAPVGVVGDEMLSTILVSFTLKRKPTFLVISLLLPIVFLSLLNLLVFVIPVESGEKISYGITVLLALTVFMSIMSAMLPSSSESMPLIISYIFILLTISVLTVVDSVVIVKLYHMEEKENKFQKAKASYNSIIPKIGLLRSAVAPLNDSAGAPGHPPPTQKTRQQQEPSNVPKGLPRSKSSMLKSMTSKDDTKINRYKMIGKHIDIVSLVVFGITWVSVTVGFMASIAA